MRIRAARGRDAPRVLEFLQRYFPAEEAVLGTRPEGFVRVFARVYRLDTRLVLGLLRLAGRPVFRFLVGEEDGRLVATTLLTFPGPSGWISMVAVDADYRRRGFARALLEEARAISARAGKTYVGLEVLADNAPAIQLYERLGYRRLGASGFQVHESARALAGGPDPSTPAIRGFRAEDAAALAEIARRRHPPEYERVLPTRKESIQGSRFVERALHESSATRAIDRGTGVEGWVAASVSPALAAAQLSAPILAESVEPELATRLVRTAGRWIAARQDGRVVALVAEANPAGRAALEGGGFHEAIRAYALYRPVA
jgi:ribosomal protein S18 acetylase RimI-like enzyme